MNTGDMKHNLCLINSKSWLYWFKFKIVL